MPVSPILFISLSVVAADADAAAAVIVADTHDTPPQHAISDSDRCARLYSMTHRN